MMRLEEIRQAYLSVPVHYFNSTMVRLEVGALGLKIGLYFLNTKLSLSYSMHNVVYLRCYDFTEAATTLQLPDNQQYALVKPTRIYGWPPKEVSSPTFL